jgi:hypothetical protein
MDNARRVVAAPTCGRQTLLATCARADNANAPTEDSIAIVLCPWCTQRVAGLLVRLTLLIVNENNCGKQTFGLGLAGGPVALCLGLGGWGGLVVGGWRAGWSWWLILAFGWPCQRQKKAARSWYAALALTCLLCLCVCANQCWLRLEF